MGIGQVNRPKRRAVFLDRDGVLNKALVRNGKPHPPDGPDDLEILPGVPDALARLRASGFLLICVTNQPDVARGAQRREVVEAMHATMRATLPLDDILACYEDGDDCSRRKPNPGMLLEAAETYGIDLRESFMVGDRWRDIEAGRSAGCRTILIGDGYGEGLKSPPDCAVNTLRQAVEWILAGEDKNG
jgi:D-glycero-D-manno-heptose 1,7-bisphosphate phosphatase